MYRQKIYSHGNYLRSAFNQYNDQREINYKSKGIRYPTEVPIKLQDSGEKGKILNISAHDPLRWDEVLDI
jgi:hypothetical protein